MMVRRATWMLIVVLLSQDDALLQSYRGCWGGARGTAQWRSKSRDCSALQLRAGRGGVSDTSKSNWDLTRRVDDLDFVWESATSFADHAKNRGGQAWDYPREFVVEVLGKALALLKPLPTLITVTLPAAPLGRVNICGDTHGQFFDLLNIFSDDVTRPPSSDNVYLFNGDFVDRGLYSFETPFLLLALKVADPGSMHLLRGNHECTSMNEHGGFADQVRDKYDDEVLAMFRAVFQALPVCAVVQGRIFVTHGGIGRVTSAMTLAEIGRIDRFHEPFEEGRGGGGGGGDGSSTAALSELLWCDPLPDAPEGRAEVEFGLNMPRGLPYGYSWGAPATRRFLAANGLQMIVRSHQVCQRGVSVAHGSACVTVFSAPNYCDQMGNSGAVLCVCSTAAEQSDERNERNERDMQDQKDQQGTEPCLEVRAVQFGSVWHPKLRSPL